MRYRSSKTSATANGRGAISFLRSSTHDAPTLVKGLPANLSSRCTLSRRCRAVTSVLAHECIWTTGRATRTRSFTGGKYRFARSARKPIGCSLFTRNGSAFRRQEASFLSKSVARPRFWATILEILRRNTFPRNCSSTRLPRALRRAMLNCSSTSIFRQTERGSERKTPDIADH